MAAAAIASASSTSGVGGDLPRPRVKTWATVISGAFSRGRHSALALTIKEFFFWNFET